MPQQTLGQRRVRVSLNPSEDSIVDQIKQATADLIDRAQDLKTTDPEQIRCIALAQTHYEDACRWFEAALTLPKN